MAATRFGNPTSGPVSFTNLEVQMLQQAIQTLYVNNYQGMWWQTTDGNSDLLGELTTEVVTNRGLPLLH